MPYRSLYIIAYDISAPDRQRHVRRLLQGYATGGQKSLFECWLTAAEYRRVCKIAVDNIDPGTDRLHIFHLGEKSTPRLLGKATQILQEPFIIM